jgi:serine/threonine protein phosphatase PrpC
MGARRADINLGDDAMEEVSKLHSTFKEERSQKIDTESLTDSTLSDFEKRCQAFVFGSQKLSGVPGQERSKTGVTPAHISVSCIKGLKGLSDTSANQDNYSYYKYKDHELICVLDGHGPAGHHVSFRGIRTLPYFFSQSKHFPSNIPEALTEAYKKCHADLLTHSVERDFDIQVSGAACVMAVRYENKLWISNTGDSRIVLGDIQSGDVIAETNDHKPSDTSERNRLEAQGSEVQIFGFDNNVRIHRVFVRGTDYPGLCMSRSLGDQSVKEHGVIPVPDVKRIEIVPSKMFMVLASDGVWEFIPSKLVCSSLSKKLGSEGQDKCVARVVTEAKKRWKSNEGSYCDDITALLVVL